MPTPRASFASFAAPALSAMAAALALALPASCLADVESGPDVENSTRQALDAPLNAPTLQIERQSGASLADNLQLRSTDGRAVPWQQVMVWRLRGRQELGWGLAVPANPDGLVGTAGSPMAPPRGVAGAPLVGSDPAAPNAAGALLLLGAGRQLSPDLSMRVGMSVPMGKTTPYWATPVIPGEGSGDDAAGQARGQSRVGLSLQTRGPLDDLRRGLQLRMELSRSTSLSLKPRRSRVLVELRSSW